MNLLTSIPLKSSENRPKTIGIPCTKFQVKKEKEKTRKEKLWKKVNTRSQVFKCIVYDFMKKDFVARVF